MASDKSVMAVIRASRPSFRNDHDKVAFLVHASFFSADYVLTAAGKSALGEISSLLSIGEEEVGTEGWNELEDSYGFLYKKTDDKGRKKTVLVKCLAFGDILTVDAVPTGDGERKAPLDLQIKVGDYVRDGSSANYSELYKNLPEFVKNINGSILSKLEDQPEEGSSSSKSRLQIGEEHGQGQPDIGFGREPGTTSIRPAPAPPIPPLGANDLYPSLGAGMYPARDTYGSYGGMLLGPNDPRWNGIHGDPDPMSGGVPFVPPGARFDPYGPPDVPGFEPSRFVRNPRRPGSNVHPDLQHFSPF
ncbi:probable proteasome inhibitor isoform X1 [Nymphaea colorata]|nr:probable proteasome inhibitor isoform X1 [Nymphaea colorata]